MTEYLKNKPKIDFNYDPDVISATYCKHSGKLATINCSNVSTGYYAPENVPETCNVCSSIIAEPDYENISEEENNQDTATNFEDQENNNSFLGSLFDNFF